MMFVPVGLGESQTQFVGLSGKWYAAATGKVSNRRNQIAAIVEILPLCTNLVKIGQSGVVWGLHENMGLGKPRE
jgi:hypothetical protein